MCYKFRTQHGYYWGTFHSNKVEYLASTICDVTGHAGSPAPIRCSVSAQKLSTYSLREYQTLRTSFCTEEFKQLTGGQNSEWRRTLSLYDYKTDPVLPPDLCKSCVNQKYLHQHTIQLCCFLKGCIHFYWHIDARVCLNSSRFSYGPLEWFIVPRRYTIYSNI